MPSSCSLTVPLEGFLSLSNSSYLHSLREENLLDVLRLAVHGTGDGYLLTHSPTKTEERAAITHPMAENIRIQQSTRLTATVAWKTRGRGRNRAQGPSLTWYAVRPG